MNCTGYLYLLSLAVRWTQQLVSPRRDFWEGGIHTASDSIRLDYPFCDQQVFPLDDNYAIPTVTEIEKGGSGWWNFAREIEWSRLRSGCLKDPPISEESSREPSA
jgi:hypothetical protein